MAHAIPYITLGPWDLGLFTVHSFGILVATGVLIAQGVAMRRARRLGVDTRDMNRALGYMLVFGFVGAHVLALLFYEPQKILQDPWSLLRLYGSLSSYGGLLGALIGLAVFWWRSPKAPLRQIIESASFALPVGWLFGRMGCALAHDHPGRLTDFMGAVDFGAHFPGGVRHDLGLYEAAWWLVIVAAFSAIDRLRPMLRMRAWFYPGLLAVLYAPVRFLLDFLRAEPQQGGDVRYLGLTPAQYISIAILVLGLVLLSRFASTARPRPEHGTDSPPVEATPVPKEA